MNKMREGLNCASLLLLGLLSLTSCEESFSIDSQLLENQTVIDLRNYAGNIQNVHPKVLFFEKPCFEHSYWMSYTPYPNGNPDYENPCIAYSDDGLHWENIDNNPIEEVVNPKSNYYSDCHIVYNETAGTLECWYRYTNEIEKEEIIYRQTSEDGLNWGKQEELYQSDGVAKALSPSVIYNKERHLYQIWVVCWEKEHSIRYFESKNGDDWQLIQTFEFDYTQQEEEFLPWHIDVSLIDGRYVMTTMVKGLTKSKHWILFLSVSTNNETWSTPQPIKIPEVNGDKNMMYRSCLVKAYTQYRLYYSIRNNNKHWIGVSIAPSIEDFIDKQHD